MRKLTGLGMGLALMATLSVGFVPAADDYSRPRIPTADREVRGNGAYLSNFFTAITGTIDDAWDGTVGIVGLVSQSLGRMGLLVSDVGGLVDDNPWTRPLTDGFVSYHFAELSLYFTRFGNDLIETSHGLDMSGWPTYRESYLRASDGGEGWNSIDYVHFQDGWGCLLNTPIELIGIVLSDAVVRPVGNVMRLVSIPESDAVEDWALDFVELTMCHAERDDTIVVEVPVVEIREVPVETEVIREVFRTVTRETFTLRDVLFDLDSAQLTDQGQGVVNLVAEALEGRNVTALEIVGHTCDRGTEEYNLELGRRRAETVAQAMRDRGFGDTEMTVSSMGEAQPLVPNIDEAHRALNRRVEITAVIAEDE